MATPDPLALLGQLPANFGDVQGMRIKAAQLDGIAARLAYLDQRMVSVAEGAHQYQGPAADAFRARVRDRHRSVVRIVGRLTAARERLNRAAAVMDGAESELGRLRRRLEQDTGIVGADAMRLVRDAQRLVDDVRSLR